MSRCRRFASWLRSPPPTALRSRARSSPWTPSRPSWTPFLIGASLRSSAHASPHDPVIDLESSRTHMMSGALRPQRERYEVHLPGYLVENDMDAMPKKEADACIEESLAYDDTGRPA